MTDNHSENHLDDFKKQIKKLSFEDAMAEFEKIVRGLEEGQIKLEDAIASYEKGAFLQSYCETKLQEAELKLKKISKKATGEIQAEALKLS